MFVYRQKYVLACIKTLYPKEVANEMAHDLLKNARIDPTTRPFKLGIEEIAPMCLYFEKQCREYVFWNRVFNKG